VVANYFKKNLGCTPPEFASAPQKYTLYQNNPFSSKPYFTGKYISLIFSGVQFARHFIRIPYRFIYYLAAKK